MMGSKNCMNEVCRATTSSEWKKGWALKSGGFATLCYKCGSAFENSGFCEKFHSEESGWRECRICGKRIHCGCIASRYLHEYMDFGGVGCISCAKRLEIHSLQPVPIPGDIPNGTFVTNGIRDVRPLVLEHKTDDKLSTERLLQLTKSIRANDVNSSFEQLKRDEPVLKTCESGKSSAFVENKLRSRQVVNNVMHESLSQPSLNFSLTTTPLSGSSNVVPFSGGTIEGSEQNKSPFQQGQRSKNILQKPPKPSPVLPAPETNKGTPVSQPRVARPPAEGRGRNQLLPRYWPKYTDEELQQLSGNLKTTIVPLFEKILSASDAGRIGRLVLPKACAEAYFPAINQSEGIAIRIQDITGKEWTFQFRFWPNNNSRMYVLEGVTPCIQNMSLEAGDTVTFSRRDPGGQLVIGCRKASNNEIVQDSKLAVVPNGESPGETSFSGATDNLLSKRGKMSDDTQQQYIAASQRKNAKNIKNKRLLMHNDDAVELRITWEEAQELFRPSPSAEPTVIMVDNYEFEEFEEPPIFGKRTIFISRPSGEQEQLAQCDSCGKWRRLPLNALLSVKWTCSENIWDSNRSSCSAAEDVNPSDLESFFSMNKDFKKRRISDGKGLKEGEPSGLDALATAAVLGDNIVDIGESSMGATTRHPRHRPGCTCIVCIQPPSGKGKHESSCKCNVCLTVRRRFKTLMMRKKKRQSDREAELALEKDKMGLTLAKVESEDMTGHAHALLNMTLQENDINIENNDVNVEEANNMGGVLDLNCDPHREDEILTEAAGVSLATLINAASLPMDMYSEGEENGISSPGACLQENVADEGGSTTGDVEQEKNNNEEG